MSYITSSISSNSLSLDYLDKASGRLPYPFHLSHLKEHFEKLRDLVLSKRPVLKEIYNLNGQLTPLEYATVYPKSEISASGLGDREQLYKVVYELLENRLGDICAREVVEQIKVTNFVSTADHHGPISDPYFLNANLTTALASRNYAMPIKYLVVFSCANVSLNNSTYPRGIMFTAQGAYESKLMHLPFFESASRLCPVINFRSLEIKDVLRAKKELAKMFKESHLSASVYEKMNALIEEVFESPSLFRFSNYAEQITQINFVLWKKILGEKLGDTQLVYLEQEKIVADLISQCHIDSNSLIHEILFDPSARGLFLGIFDGVEGGFDTSSSVGSFLFWGLPKGSKYRVQLWLKDDKLVSQDGLVEYEMSREKVREALQLGELIPSMLLTFVVISFFYGVKCLGGFCQVNYLTEMQRRFKIFLSEFRQGVFKVPEVDTKNLCEDMSIAFLQNRNDKLTLASGIDLILYRNQNFEECLQSTAGSIHLNESLDLMMPEFYKVLVHDKDRSSNLVNITQEQIAEYNGLSLKIRACAKL